MFICMWGTYSEPTTSSSSSDKEDLMVIKVFLRERVPAVNELKVLKKVLVVEPCCKLAVSSRVSETIHVLGIWC